MTYNITFSRNSSASLATLANEKAVTALIDAKIATGMSFDDAANEALVQHFGADVMARADDVAVEA